MRLIIPFLILLFATGCGITGESVADKANQLISFTKEDGKIDVYFCPEKNCSAYLVQMIDSAENYVYCAFYDLDLKEVIDALKAKKNHGLDVKLVVDNDNFKTVENLSFVINDTSSQFSHNKFCVIDDRTISSGSFNPTKNDNYKNNNNLVIINSRYLAGNYKDEFDELWNREWGKGAKVNIPVVEVNGTRIENYFCPEDDCALKIVEEIDKAEKNIYFLAFSFTHEQIANSLALAVNRSVEVKGVFEETTNKQYSKYEFLKFQGADVKWDNTSVKMHDKVFIIDEETVITGSFNPTKSADTQNDENILIIHSKEIAKLYLDEFEKIFS